MTQDTSRWPVGVYRALIRLLLPRAFRRRHGAEMVETFSALYEQARRQRGLRGALVATARELRDLGRIAWQQRAPRSPGSWLDTLRSDARMGLRQLRRAPRLSAVTVVLIAVGVGTTGALFAVVDGLLFRPLPLPGAERIVVGLSTRDGEPFNAAGRDVLAWSAARHLGVTGAATTRSHTHSGDLGTFRFVAAHVTPGYLEVLGFEPILGRRLRREDTRAALIGHGMWQERFGGADAVLDRTLDVDGTPHAIVGVAPPRFDLPMRTQAWVPMEPGTLRAHGDSRRFFFLARLRDGAGLEEARAEIAAIAQRLAVETPDSHAGWGTELIPLREQLLYDIGGRLPVSLGALLGAVAFLFLVTCANAANLTLIRLLHRRREMQLRTALGAPAGRLRHQVVVECLVLALLGGIVGSLLAAASLPLLAGISPLRSDAFGSTLLELRLGPRGVVFCLSLAMLAGLLTGAITAARSTRHRPSPLPHHGREVEPTGADRRLLYGLALAEIAIGVVLLVAAGMALRGLVNLRALELGFVPEGVLMARIDPPPARYPRAEDRHELVDRLRMRLLELPGVTGAALSSNAPLDMLSWGARWRTPEGTEAVAADRAVTPGYLELLEVRLVAGRSLPDEPRPGVRPLVVTTDLARQLWPGESPLGKRVFRNDEALPRTVVGLVAPVREDPEIFRRMGAAAYHFYRQSLAERAPTLLVRHDGDPDSLTGSLRATVARVDPHLPVFDVRPLAHQVAGTMARDRFIALVASALATISVLVAALGVYGTLTFLVGRRRREIGIRLALGASRHRLLRGILLRALGLAACGMIAGLAGALAIGDLLSAALFEVPDSDPLAMLAAVLILLATTILAAWAAGVRTTRVDPVAALTPD